MPAELINYYTILGVAPHAEDIVIRAAYRALMQRHHPDKNLDAKGNSAKEASQKILAIQEAFKTLSNPDLRKSYDEQLGVLGVNKHALLHVASPSVLERTGLSPDRIHLQDIQTWQALLAENPRFAEHFVRLSTLHPKLAEEYKTLILELIAERVMSKMVDRLCDQFEGMNVVDIEKTIDDAKPR